eukprot:SAG31_NODE_6567_length_1972_cov_3.049653_2_plen_108_part_00
MPEGAQQSDNHLGLPGGQTPVGLFGGCEVRIHSGPVFVDEEYSITRELVAVGETPKTEFRWTRAEMHDNRGRLIAEMTLQEMMLKGSVKGYTKMRTAANAAMKIAKI